ncbi:DUF5691 domain-containing protein [Nocardiopsis changdeensis]|uniref:HEAT repeat domain-containing protein n=1 Tax=Nocardiopsis changdeensis TaxID=2831969 RepID=A0ABX8BKP2_9ACTN|nr:MULTISPECIES: DUF5691 domain-containing protein [Nocardiopsis]QUX22587.1 hypothetical protein KGD84_30545 [Nocardiopsis changdeensis]QYX38528.1 hypothetical protein K1J57_07925 [Nocardiopsis sp. MT53]
MTTPSPAPDSWDLLVSAALVGTARRAVPETPDLPATGESEGAAALLDRAALATVRRLAGYTPARVDPIDPDPGPDLPEVGEQAVRRLEAILADRSELLPEWLELVAAAGLRAPAEHLPALLDRGARDSALRSAVAAAGGSRGRWLARFDPDWAYLLTESDPADVFDEDTWLHGTEGERRRMLGALRAADPARGRELLAAVWPDLRKAELRRRLLEAMETGLGPEDADLLETALDDKGANVRGLALSLLTRLPHSAHADRLRDHVRAHAGPGPKDTVVVTPVEPDEAGLLRDLALARPTGEIGLRERSEYLWTLVTRTPLDVWTDLLGTDPAGVLERVARSGDDELHDALLNAIGVQEDAVWARAALGLLEGRVTDRMVKAARGRRSLQLEPLLRVLPVGERCALVERSFGPGTGTRDVWSLLNAVPGPWTAKLVHQVVDRLGGKGWDRDQGGYRSVCLLVAERTPPELVHDLPRETPNLAAVGGGPSDHAYQSLLNTLRFRLDMHKELV